jgi:hypothetical protein
MNDLSRRDLVRVAAGLAVLATGNLAVGQDAKEPAAADAKDALLALAVRNPHAFALGEPVTFRIEGDGLSRDLVVTSALDERGGSVAVHLRSGTVRVFRADAGVDDFTKQGGLYWRFHDTKGNAKLKTPGAIVMMVREGYHTVRCYEMEPDYRC